MLRHHRPIHDYPSYYHKLTELLNENNHFRDQQTEDKLIRAVIQDWEENLKGEHDELIELLKEYVSTTDSAPLKRDAALSLSGFVKQLTPERVEQAYHYCKENKKKAVGTQSLAYEMITRRKKIAAILDERHEQNHAHLSMLPDEVWHGVVGPHLDLPSLAVLAGTCSFFRDKAKTIRGQHIKNMAGKDYRGESVLEKMDSDLIIGFDRVMPIAPNTFIGLSCSFIRVIKVNNAPSKNTPYTMDPVKVLSCSFHDGRNLSTRPIAVASPSSIAIVESRDIKIWNWQTDTLVKTINHSAEIKALAMSPKGELVYADCNGVIRFYDLDKDQPVYDVSTNYRLSWVKSMLISEDEKIILMGIDIDASLQIYTKNGEPVYRTQLMSDKPCDETAAEHELYLSLKYLPLQGCLLNNNRLAIARGYTLSILDLNDGKEITALQFPYEETIRINGITSLPLSPDKLIIENHNYCHVFDIKAGKLYQIYNLVNDYKLGCVVPLDNGDLLSFPLYAGVDVCRFPKLADTLKSKDTHKEENRPRLTN